jgi:hypothetical protein
VIKEWVMIEKGWYCHGKYVAGICKEGSSWHLYVNEGIIPDYSAKTLKQCMQHFKKNLKIAEKREYVL